MLHQRQDSCYQGNCLCVLHINTGVCSQELETVLHWLLSLLKYDTAGLVCSTSRLAVCIL